MPDRLTHKRSMHLLHLAQAEQHVAEGKRHIAEQEQRIADFVRLGHDTTQARKLLENFSLNQVQHVEHRDRLLKALGLPLFGLAW